MYNSTLGVMSCCLQANYSFMHCCMLYFHGRNLVYNKKILDLQYLNCIIKHLLGSVLHDSKNYQKASGYVMYLPQPSASTYHINLSLDNSHYGSQPKQKYSCSTNTVFI